MLGDERHPADDRVDVLTQIRGVGPHTATLVNGGPWSFRRSQAPYRSLIDTGAATVRLNRLDI